MEAAEAKSLGISYGKYKAICYEHLLEEQAKEAEARAHRLAERKAIWEKELARRAKAHRE